MIYMSNIECVGWHRAIVGMRNPMNSWRNSDSYYDYYGDAGQDMIAVENSGDVDYVIGPNDQDLAIRLRNAGTDHRKFMRMIVVYVDITAPLYWWKEFDTYKIGTVANSCSTMHKLTSRDLTLDDFSIENLNEYGKSAMSSLVNQINELRVQCVEEKDPEKSLDIFRNIVQLLPSSYNQKRTVMLNYEVLANIYASRKNHKLAEWRTFCSTVTSMLPFSELITGDIKEDCKK